MDKEIGNQVEIPDIYKVYFKSNLVKEERKKPLHMNAKTNSSKIYEMVNVYVSNLVPSIS